MNLEPKKGELRFGIIVVLVSFVLFLMVLLAEIGWERPLKFIGFNNIFRGKSKEEIDDGLIPLISIFWLMVYIGIGSLDFAYQATSNSEMEAWMTIFYFFLWLFGFFAGRAMVLDRAQLQKQTDWKTWLIASLPIYIITWLLFILIFQQYTKFSSTGIVISSWKQDKFNFAFSLLNMAWLLLFVPLLGGWIIVFTIEKNKKVKHVSDQ